MRRVRAGAVRRPRKRWHTHALPLSRAVGVVADQFETCSTRVQEVRNAVALELIGRQREHVKKLGGLKHIVAVIFYDHTDQQVGVKKKFKWHKQCKVVNQVLPTMMVHVSLACYSADGTVDRQELNLPPASCISTSAETAWIALQHRLSLVVGSFQEMRGRCEHLSIISISDNAPSCNKLFNILRAQQQPMDAMLQVGCQMHLLSLTVAFMLTRVTPVLNSMFCACNLLHRAKTLDSLMVTLPEFMADLDAGLEVESFHAPTEADKRHNRDILSLLQWDEADLEGEEVFRRYSLGKARQAALHRVFVEFFPYQWTPAKTGGFRSWE